MQAPYPIPILDNAVVAHGNYVYSFGGVSDVKVTAESYRFDGTAWQAIAPMPSAREYSVAVSDGRYIYLLGGLDNMGTRTTSLYRYDPEADTYRTLAPFGQARFAPGAVYLDGKIYLMSGITSSSTMTSEAYSIEMNSWTKIAPYPLPVGFVSIIARGGYIYGIGGVDNPNVAIAKTYRYDPRTNQWSDTVIADLPSSRWGAASAMYNGDILVAGGYVGGGAAENISTTALTYTFATDQWTAIASMQQARTRMSGGSMGTGFFSVGGRSSSDTFTGTTSNQRYIGSCAASVGPTETSGTATRHRRATERLDPFRPTRRPQRQPALFQHQVHRPHRLVRRRCSCRRSGARGVRWRLPRWGRC